MPELKFKSKEFVYNHHLTVPFRWKCTPTRGYKRALLEKLSAAY